MAEILLQRRGGMLFPVDDQGRKFVRGLDGVARIKVVKPREARRDVLNRLSHAIYNEAAKIKGDSYPDDEKAYCKLTHGIPTLIHDPEEGEEYMDWYRRLLSGIPYEERLERMKETHRFYTPVTSLMTDEQISRYIKRCVFEYSRQGVVILTPKERAFLDCPEAQRV